MSNYESHYEQLIIANSYAYGKLNIVKLLLIYQYYCQFFPLMPLNGFNNNYVQTLPTDDDDMFIRLLALRGSMAGWFVLLESPDWFDWEGDSANVGSEMVRCNGANGLSTLGNTFLCLNSEKKNEKLMIEQMEVSIPQGLQTIYLFLLFWFWILSYLNTFSTLTGLNWDNKLQCQSM